jgi:major membrane immunogen (membrane-anchored lipoprotein)
VNLLARAIIFLLVLSCCYIPVTIAQQKDIVLLGTISTKDGRVYAYKLQFKDTLGKIKGFSVTDINGADETKTTITGSINAAHTEVNFTETKIVSSKSGWGKNDFCYMDGHITMQGGDYKMWKGSFTGHTADRQACGKGNMILMGGAEILDGLTKMQKETSSDTVAKLVSRLKAAIEDTVKTAPVQVRRLQPGTTYEVQGNGKNATLDIWDDKIVDGDIVTVTHNGKTILSNYTLQKEHKQLDIALWSDTPDRLTISANNQGSQPPNSAMMKLVSGNEEYLINAETEPGKPVNIILKPVKR